MVGSGREERAWIRGAQDGSVAHLEALFRHHWPRAYRAAYLVVHDAAAAEAAGFRFQYPQLGPALANLLG